MDNLIEDAKRQAARLAAEGVESIVYRDDDRVYVRPASEPAPEGARVLFIAQLWKPGVVWIRYQGAKSEWLNPQQWVTV